MSVALSALTGYVLFSGNVDRKGWLLMLGVFLMACSASVINHWQERHVDAQMPRTKNRPIPSGKIKAFHALILAAGIALTGSAVMYLSNPIIVMVLSWVTLFFYNVVYTPLKKVSAYAVVPGSIIGALPPVIGWVGAGGSVNSEIILLVAAFFFIGQIPHFWLLMLMFGEQYKLAKLPSLSQIFNEEQIKRVTYSWIITTAVAAFLIILFVINNKVIVFLLLIYIFYFLFSLARELIVQEKRKVRLSFLKLNILYLSMMIFLIVDGLLRTS